jgi:hypothetical protein
VEITSTFKAGDRAGWRRWLTENHALETGMMGEGFRKSIRLPKTPQKRGMIRPPEPQRLMRHLA